MASQTLYNKLWDRHLVAELADGSALLYVDRHLLHEVTSPRHFQVCVQLAVNRGA